MLTENKAFWFERKLNFEKDEIFLYPFSCIKMPPFIFRGEKREAKISAMNKLFITYSCSVT